MVLFESIVLSMWDAVMMVIILHSMIKIQKIKRKYVVAYILFTGFSIALACRWIEHPIASRIATLLLGLLLLLIYLWSQGCKKLWSNILTFVASSLLLLMIQLIAIILLNLILDQVEYTFLNGILCQSFAFLVLLFMVRITPISIIYGYIEINDLMFGAVTASLFVLYYYINVLWNLNFELVNRAAACSSLISLFALAIHTILLRDGQRCQIYQQKLKLYDSYLPVMDHIVEEFQSYQHDVHNHIQTIMAMKMSDCDEELDRYISKINDHDIWKELTLIPDKIVLAFLYSKYLEAQNKEIHCHFHIRDYSFAAGLDSYELVELYGILIDNALDAVQSYGKTQRIDIFLYKEGKQNIFAVQNPYSFLSTREINQCFRKGYTTKGAANRGIGLAKARAIIEKKKGTISFYYDTSIQSVIVKLKHN